MLRVTSEAMTPRPPLYARICDLPECKIEFQTDNRRKTFCSPTHASLARMRRSRAKNRGGGGGNGGGGQPVLSDTITPVDSRAIYVPDICYRTPEEQPGRKPSVSDKPSIPENSRSVSLSEEAARKKAA